MNTNWEKADNHGWRGWHGFAGMMFIVESTETAFHLLIRELRCKVLKNLSGEENQSTDLPAFARGYGVEGEFFTEGNEGNKAGDFDLATFVIFVSFC